MKALVLLAGALLVYGLLAVLVGWGAVASQLGALPLWVWGLAAVVVLAGHVLLFVRWQLLLRGLGHPLAARASGAIYLAGLGLIAAPARSGEALRGLWLQRRHRIPLRIGVAATAAERLLDLASALLVLAWGLGLVHQRLALLAVLAAVAALVWVLSHPAILKQMEHTLAQYPMGRRWKRLRRVVAELLHALIELRKLLRLQPLSLGLLVSVVVWLMEAMLLKHLLGQMGPILSVAEAAVIRTATSLGGVLSLLPGGLGPSELTSIGLAMAFGASKSQALATTVLLRAATLLWPAMIGTLALLAQPDLQSLGRNK